MLDTDEGARRLGEVALVPHSSPISKSGLLFFNTLFDENAASHIALGQAYSNCFRNGGTLSPKRAGGARRQQQPDPYRLDDRLGRDRRRRHRRRRQRRAGDARGRVGVTPGAQASSPASLSKSGTFQEAGEDASSRLLRAVHPVAGVAQAGHDIAVLVEMAVDRGGPDRHVGMARLSRANALRRGEQADEADVAWRRAPSCARPRRPPNSPVASIGSSR